jgi:hypothetical protein
MTVGGGVYVGRDGYPAEATADGLARLCREAVGCGHGRKPNDEWDVAEGRLRVVGPSRVFARGPVTTGRRSGLLESPEQLTDLLLQSLPFLLGMRCTAVLRAVPCELAQVGSETNAERHDVVGR